MQTVLRQTKATVNFPLEDIDKHVVNELHIARKSHDATQKKCLHVVHLMYHVVDFKQTCGIKNVTSEGGKKKSQVSGSTGKSNTFACLLKPKLPSCWKTSMKPPCHGKVVMLTWSAEGVVTQQYWYVSVSKNEGKLLGRVQHRHRDLAVQSLGFYLLRNACLTFSVRERLGGGRHSHMKRIRVFTSFND